MSTTELDRALHASVMKREAVKEAKSREERTRHEEEVKLGFGATEMSVAELKKVIDSDRRMYYRTLDLNDKLYIHYKGWRDIQNLEGWTGLKALYAECNAFDKIQGLQMCKNLKSLFLQENCIRKIEGLEGCTELWNLNLSSNYIERIENLKHCTKLNTLIIAKNKLGFGGVDDLVELESMDISSLDIQDNKISDPDVVPEVLSRMPDLRCLYMKGNPCSKRVPNYRKSLTVYCPHLTYLDDRPVFEEDRRASEAFNRGGIEAERAERRLIKQENTDRHDRNMKAFQQMIERAKSEKRERDAMQAEDKYTAETDPVDSREKRMQRQVDQWREENKDDLKDDAKERAERMLAAEKEQQEHKEDTEVRAEPEAKEEEKNVDNRKLVYEDIWDDVPAAPAKPSQPPRDEGKAAAGVAAAERLRSAREAAAAAAEQRATTASAPSQPAAFQPPARAGASAFQPPARGAAPFQPPARGAAPAASAAPSAEDAAASEAATATGREADASRHPDASPPVNSELDEMD